MEDKKYSNSIHRLGRVGTLIATLFIMGIPAIICWRYNCWPSFTTVLQPALAVLAIMGPATCTEVFSYAPVLGSASYITFITGNIMNLKLPAAISAQTIAEVDPNTPAADAVATMSIALSSLETLVIVSLGVLLVQPLQPFLTAPAFQTATGYILPALFGGMVLSIFSTGKKPGKPYVKNKLLIPLLPLALVILCVFIIPKISSYQGYLIIIMIFVSIGWAYLLYKKGIVRMEICEDTAAQPATQSPAQPK